MVIQDNFGINMVILDPVLDGVNCNFYHDY